MSVLPPIDGLPMTTGLLGTVFTGPANVGGSVSGRPEKSAVKYFKLGLFWLPAVLIAGLAGWMLLYGYAGNSAEGEAEYLVTAATEPTPPPAAVPTVAQDGSTFDPAITEAITPAPTPADNGLNISSQ